ncbi:RNA-directed DNA polymerase from mobile element jockey [Frankliniella fusca]|uniref:RNA-directed DNA polymerase from mobile element jockey n=1 Tax=Frankliniella fusca TaxID=407009 RepID=A0AAE1LU27_9NEOP|nr:RNA-directed DNA polymerase from mobile element jockey [Frankliniella fusca]
MINEEKPLEFKKKNVEKEGKLSGKGLESTSQKIDIIAVSETFYGCVNDIVSLNNYNVFVANRPGGKGGGVAIYVKKKYSAKLLCKSDPCDAGIKKPDYIILEVSFCDTKLLVACVYRPPKTGYFDEFADNFISLGIDYKYHIVTGDVNAHFGSDKACDLNDGKQVHEFLDVFNLERVPFGPTYHVNNYHSSLDMVASTLPERLAFYNQFPSGLSNHDLLTAVFSLSVPKFKPQLITMRTFKNFNIDEFRRDVTDAPWHEMVSFCNINAKVEFFNKTVHELFNKHAPYITFEANHRPVPWMSDELKRMIEEKDRRHRKVKFCKDVRLIASYKKFRNAVNSQIRNAKLRYSYKMLSNCNSPKTLWRNLKKLEVVGHDRISVAKTPTSEELNAHYTAVSCQDEALVKENIEFYRAKPVLPVDEPFFFKHVMYEDLRKAIFGVSPTAKGVDDISASMLKLCLAEFSPAVLHIFNYSLQSGCFPDLWKIANVKPLPKKTGACMVKDFRPISLLSVVVNNCIIPYLDSVNDLGVVIDKHLSWEQHTLSVCKKAYAALHGIKKNCHLLPLEVRKRLVESLVFPIIDYGMLVSAQNLVVSQVKLQRVQNACARIIFDLRSDCHISKYIYDLKWLNISNRFTYAAVTLLKKVLMSNSPSYLAVELNYSDNLRSRYVRSSRFHLRIPHHRTDKCRGAFWIVAPLLWNNIPDYVLCINNISSFKRKLKDYLLGSNYISNHE